MTVPKQEDLMGLPGYVPLPIIPKCDLVVRRGERPDPGFGNVFNWTPELAKRPLEFEPLVVKEPEPRVAADADTMRKIQILECIDGLAPEDYTPNGVPRLATLREKLHTPEMTQAELHSIWAEYKEMTK